MKITLTARPPFSLPSVIRSHGWIQLEPFREDESTGSLSYIAHLESGNVIDVCIRANPNGVDIEITDNLSPEDLQAIREFVSWMLNLDQDFSTFYALANQEPKLAQAARRAQGRILRSPTLFEDVVKTILTTNTLWAATNRTTLGRDTIFRISQRHFLCGIYF